MASSDHVIENIDPDLLKLITPFSLVLAGPSGSGKSKFLFELLDNLENCTLPKIEKVIFIYGVYQDLYKNYPNIHFTDSLEYMKVRPPENTLLILDDCMSQVKDSSLLEQLFTRGRHEHISVILVLQSMFYKGTVLKTVRDNATYMAITNHIQDQTRLYTFSSQLELKNSSYFIDSYADAMKTRFNYLFIDLHPKSQLRDAPYFIKYRSGVTQGEGQTLYLDVKKYKNVYTL
jgi:hypothetical protein